MGQLVEGEWEERPVTDGTDEDGRFVRQQAQFRQWIRADGSTDFQPEAGRYHIYLAAACPWCHRVDTVLALKGLKDVISTSFVHPLMLEGGWKFSSDFVDPLFGYAYAHQLYQRADPRYTGRVTVPVLWDKKLDRPVSNESSEIIRMLDLEFDDLGASGPSLYPEPLRAAIDDVNARVYDTVNNGVYKCGFAQSQKAYEEALGELFDSLDFLERRLEGQTWLVGDQLTEADVRLWVTLLRFDAVYVGHFKCNLRRVADHPNLQALLERILALPGVRETVDIAAIKQHYYGSHPSLNPAGIVPVGPELRWLPVRA